MFAGCANANCQYFACAWGLPNQFVIARSVFRNTCRDSGQDNPNPNYRSQTRDGNEYSENWCSGRLICSWIVEEEFWNAMSPIPPPPHMTNVMHMTKKLLEIKNLEKEVAENQAALDKATAS